MPTTNWYIKTVNSLFNMNNFKEILSPIQSDLAFFEKNLKELIEAENNFLKADLIDFLFNNPKRLRPIFVFLFSKILKIDNKDIVNKIALIVELIHSASLIHDDIIDESKVRRNLPTFFHKHNSKIAVLEGDLLLNIALLELSKTNNEILKIFSLKLKETLDGEINQNTCLNKITSVEEYIKRSFQKTGNLYMAGLLSLFSLKEIDDEIKKTLSNFLENYTIAFQIQNDIEDVKKNNSDYKNGNYTLPMIYLSLEKESLSDCIKKTELKRDYYYNQAVLNLDNIENSIYKDSILKLIKYTLRS